MTHYITNIRELQRGQTFHRINRNGDWYCVSNEDGNILICNNEMFHSLTYNPNIIDTENDIYVMVLSDTGNEKPQLEPFYVTNENSNITHLMVGDKLICGHRFTQNSVKSETGIITCQHCLKLAPKSIILA